LREHGNAELEVSAEGFWRGTSLKVNQCAQASAEGVAGAAGERVGSPLAQCPHR
jgi:hypothetical protein